MSVENLLFLRRMVQARHLLFHPDHPLLLRGPEALIGGEGNLVAVFAPQKTEELNPAHLVSRLISARLALPSETRTILILKVDQTSRFGDIERHFSLTTSAHDQYLRKFLDDARDYGNTEPMNRKIQVQANQDFDLALRITEYSYRENRIAARSASDRKAIPRRRESHEIRSGQVKFTPANNFIIDGESTWSITGTRRSDVVRQLKFATSGNLLRTYELDRGIPYPRAQAISLAMAERADEVLPVRGKSIFGSAFAGVAIVPTSDEAILEKAVGRLRSTKSGPYFGWPQ